MHEDFIRIGAQASLRLIMPRPAILVISSDLSGKVNGMTAAWTTPLSHNPPLVGVSISPKRYTYQLIKESHDFTLNVLSVNYVRQVNFLGTVSGRNRDKIRESGLTLSGSRIVRAPHVLEALAVLECIVENEVKAGDHNLFIARVVDAYVKNNTFEETYKPNKAKILMHLGGSCYVTLADELIEL